jgi:hypothetical protein
VQAISEDTELTTTYTLVACQMLQQIFLSTPEYYVGCNRGLRTFYVMPYVVYLAVKRDYNDILFFLWVLYVK